MSIGLQLVGARRVHRGQIASATQFGVGDGSTSTFGLLDARGRPIKRDVSVSAIHRTDWQGRQLLYATARTNYAWSTEDFSSAAYSTSLGGTGSLIRTVNYAAAPDGTMTADRCVFDIGSGSAATDVAQIHQSGHALTVGASMTTSIYARTNDGSTVNMVMIGVGTALLQITIGPTWTRFQCPQVVVGGSFNFRLRIRGNEITGPSHSSHADVLLWGLQTEDGLTSWSYLKNTSTTAPVTVTDYTLSGSSVALGQTPVTGAVLDWDGSGTSVG